MKDKNKLNKHAKNYMSKLRVKSYHEWYLEFIKEFNKQGGFGE